MAWSKRRSRNRWGRWQRTRSTRGPSGSPSSRSTTGSDSIWLMDMGRPMSWRGPATAPQRAFRFSLSDAGERDVVAEIGRPNAWNLDVLWRNEFRNTVQMMLYADTGELVLEDAPKIELMAERGDARSLSWISRRERNGLERRLVPVQRWGCSCARASAGISTSRRGGGRSRAYS